MHLSMVNFEALRLGLEVLQLIGLVVLAIYTHITGKSKANAKAIEEITKTNVEANNAIRRDFEAGLKSLEIRVGNTERRNEVLESQQKQAPNHADLSKVYDRMNAIAESMERQNGQLNALTHQLSMVNEYLLNNRGDKR